MTDTTLCYIEHKGCYLMLHRTKKAHDINEGKWIGVGGKFLDRESPEECLLREVREETGYELTSWRFRGFITFLQENYETEYMCLYTADGFRVPSATKSGPNPDAKSGTSPDAKSGPALNLWPGDRIFLRLLAEREEFFSLKLLYSGDDLLEAVLDGQPLAL